MPAPPRPLRIASFNVENLFDRARALNQESWSDGRPALEAYAELSKILEQPSYAGAEAKILKLLTRLGLDKTDDGGEFALLRQNRGHLVRRPKRGPIELVAKGRADWIGWVELRTEPVNELATHHTAAVIKDVDADLLAVIEAENRIALSKFQSILLTAIEGTPYGHVMLIDGNDDRGIDVGLMTKTQYPIVRIRSHIDDLDDQGKIFSRDCPEYTVKTPGGERIVLLVNHLKSKGYGKRDESNARRQRQATRIAQIYRQLVEDGESNVVVVGDFNDTPESAPLHPLLGETDLRDISTHANFDDGGRPGTFGNGTKGNKIDYILLSPALYGRVKRGAIFRKGAWGGKNGTLWPHYENMTAAVHAASDHAAIYADLGL